MNYKINLAIVGLMILAGCDTLRNTLGLQRSEPDEFNVLDRHPLTTPPGYGLRPPQSGQDNVAIIDPHAKVKESIAGQKSSSNTNVPQSAADKTLLKNLSKHPSDKDIRKTISDERQESRETVNNRLKDLSTERNNNKELIDPYAEYREDTGHAHPSEFLEQVI